MGIAVDLSMFVCAVALTVILTVILYVLLKPVRRNTALLMLGSNPVQHAIGALNALNTYRPLEVVGDAAYLKVFSREQLDAKALLSLNTHSVGFAVALIFFGSCVALDLIRFGGHLSKGEYDVQTDGRHTEAASAPPVHRRVQSQRRAPGA